MAEVCLVAGISWPGTVTRALRDAANEHMTLLEHCPERVRNVSLPTFKTVACATRLDISQGRSNRLFAGHSAMPLRPNSAAGFGTCGAS